jgi:hypothetical protein
MSMGRALPSQRAAKRKVARPRNSRSAWIGHANEESDGATLLCLQRHLADQTAGCLKKLRKPS